MATLNALSDRLRSELGDIGRSFSETFTGDGTTVRFQLTQNPIQGRTLVVKVGNVDVSQTTTVEEAVGVLILSAPPANNAVITVTGLAYRYFTDSDIAYYVNTAYTEHSLRATDSNGSPVTMSSLSPIDEYPIVIYASSLALYTLATDAAFDIDIISPDGVNIPRSERYRQLMAMVEQRKEQYRELCKLLNIGMHRIEVFSLRRISRLTNRYVPIYRPQEVDDGSIPQRVFLPLPSYGDVQPNVPVVSKDFSLYAGDDFNEIIRFSMDISNYSFLSQVRLYPSVPGSAVGPVIIGAFTFTTSASVSGGMVDTLTMHLPGSVTKDFPNVAYYDLQLTAPNGTTKTYTYGKVFTHAQVSEPLGPF